MVVTEQMDDNAKIYDQLISHLRRGNDIKVYCQGDIRFWNGADPDEDYSIRTVASGIHDANDPQDWDEEIADIEVKLLLSKYDLHYAILETKRPFDPMREGEEQVSNYKEYKEVHRIKSILHGFDYSRSKFNLKKLKERALEKRPEEVKHRSNDTEDFIKNIL